MRDIEKYKEDCRRMARLKRASEHYRNVYSDVDFDALLRECEEYEEFLQTAREVFGGDS